jgi:dihydrofolate reductase
MPEFNAVICKVDCSILPEEFLEFKDKLLSKHLIFGRKGFEALERAGFPEKTVWVFTKNIDVYGWIQSSYEDSWINIIVDPAHLPEQFSYTVCGGDSIFNLFLDKIKEVYIIHNGQEDNFFKEKFKNSEIVLTKDEFYIIKYT